jgi:hypothetical protein
LDVQSSIKKSWLPNNVMYNVTQAEEYNDRETN